MYLDGSSKFGIARAQSYRHGFVDACAYLEKNPLLVRERTEYSPPIRVHRYGSHVIVFIVADADVVVLRVRHGSEDWLSDPVGANDQ